MLFKPPRTVGLILNISLRMIDGLKLADIVRTELVDFANALDAEDQLYLNMKANTEYNRDDIAESSGRRVALVGNWKPTEVSPKLQLEFKKAMHAVSFHGDMDGEWYVCYITDRYIKNDEAHLSQILDQSNQLWGETHKSIVITIGDHYHFNEHETACSKNSCKYIHLSSPVGIKNELCGWMGLES
jgi:hypothetical protein